MDCSAPTPIGCRTNRSRLMKQFRDAHVGPDALVWAAGSQPGGLSRDSGVILPVFFRQGDMAGGPSLLKPSFARLGRRGVCPYAKLEAAFSKPHRNRLFQRLLRRNKLTAGPCTLGGWSSFRPEDRIVRP